MLFVGDNQINISEVDIICVNSTVSIVATCPEQDYTNVLLQ